MSETPIEGIDYQAGLAQYQKEAMYHRILRIYLKSVPDILDTLTAFTKENLQDYLVTVHGFKGASYGVQANRIAGLAQDLEAAGKEGNLVFIEENNHHLIEEARALLARLKTYLDQQDKSK